MTPERVEVSAYVVAIYRWARKRHKLSASNAWLLATMWAEIQVQGGGMEPDDWLPG